MSIFYELLAKRAGFSRIGRIIISKESKIFLSTPNILVPINDVLLRNFHFLEAFEKHGLYIISNEEYLKSSFIRDKFKNKEFVYIHPGTVEKFQEILFKNREKFSENKNLVPIIPFNIPITTLSRDFAKKEIENYLDLVKNILINYNDLELGLTIRVFDYPELFNLYIPLIKNRDNVKILNFSDIFDNIHNFRSIISIIVQIKQELDNNIVLIASGRIIPKFFPILIYLGIDLIDCSYLLYLSSENYYDTIEHLLPIYKLKYLPCSCLACKGRLGEIIEEKYSTEKTILLCVHNLTSALNYMNKIKQYLTYEDYRAFVEKSSLDDTNMISMLRILDKQYFDVIRYETPIIQENKTINSFGASSYFRPDFQEFRERTINAFEPEPWTSLIVLLPCSAKKPYSESKSHRQFLQILRKFPEFPNFQEIILTSPLGAIPRQLENIYPVNSYDISVTGEWDAEELNIAANMLVKMLEKFDNRIPIICHLDGGYLKIVEKVIPKIQNEFFFSEIYKKPTSKESLSSLENLIKNKKSYFTPEQNVAKGNYLSKTLNRKFVKILDYQFGPGSGLKILSNEINTRKNKRNTQVEIIDKNSKEKLGSFKFSKGQIFLTIKGASRLAPFSNNSNIIVFNGNKISGNTLFRPGIINYSPNLLPYEHVIILNEERKSVIGIGQLLVGTDYIKNTKSGRIAEIYESL